MSKIISHNRESNRIFEKFISIFGLDLTHSYAYTVLSTKPSRLGTKFIPEISYTENKEFIEEELCTCSWAAAFFRWIIPNNRELEEYPETLLPRPKNAIGPYEYDDTLTFNNNTIIHGLIEGEEAHFFFATCMDNIVTIYNTYAGQVNFYIKKHSISKANKMWKALSTESNEMENVPAFNQLSADFFGFERVLDENGIPFKFVMHQHSSWLPTTDMIIDYLNILKIYMKYKVEKQIINKAISWLEDLD